MVEGTVGWMVVSAVFALRMAVAKLDHDRIFGSRS